MEAWKLGGAHTVNRKDAKGGANRFGLHRSLCGFAADRDRRPPFRALSVSWTPCPSPVYRALLHLLNLLYLLWKLGFPCTALYLSSAGALRSRGRFGASRLHAPFSVLRGAPAPLVLPQSLKTLPQPRNNPRRRGEEVLIVAIPLRSQGSSPQARGRAIPPSILIRPFGIIPAGAGKRVEPAVKGNSSWDHPRRRGEEDPMERRHADRPGSSPQARGRGVDALGVGAGLRIIPAGAGKSRRAKWLQVRRWDHPRRRGEESTTTNRRSSITGSSPRVRGEAYKPFPVAPFAGIIPAGAGRRRWRQPRRWPPRDHPRGCGEKFASSSPTRRRRGSSPRVRGEA